jgi:hypothetical protein
MSLLLALTAGAGGAYTITAEAGAYVVSGQSATITKSKVISADAGAYSVDGQTAQILHSKLIGANAGAYVVNGVDATITYTPAGGAYTINAEPGAYVVTGFDAIITKSSSAISPSGGWHLPQGRRKSRKEVYAERVKLGILPPAIMRAAEKVAMVAETVEEFKAERPRYEEMFMRELSLTKWSPDYTRSIQIQIELMQQDDEDILLLMM